VDTSGHVKYGTVQGWVSDLKRAMIDTQMDYSAFDDPWFRAGMTGLQRIMGETRPRQALPVTLPILSAVISAAFKGCPKPTLQQLAITASLSLGFGCFLRSGEFTYVNFDSATHLRRRDVDLYADPPTLRIRFSKMDRTGQGRTVHIPVASDLWFAHVCPTRLLRRLFLEHSAHPDAPLSSLSLDPRYWSFPAAVVISELRHLLAL
jgi:hypothetical protein